MISEDLRHPSAELIEELNQSITPFELSPQSVDQLLFEQRSILESRKVILFGEGTHGTSEFRKLGLYFFQHLVEQYNFDTFAFEDFYASNLINEYVQSGEGDIQVIMQDLYPVFRTQEVLEIIEYMKAHNKKSAKKLKFIGFDRPESSNDTEESPRDQDMANNILDFLKSNPSSKVFAFAHNLHIAKDYNNPQDLHWWKPMGFYLKKELGALMHTYATLFGTGRVRATKVDDASSLRRTLDLHEVVSVPETFLENFFLKANQDNFLINLASSSPKLEALFSKPTKIRTVGWGIYNENPNLERFVIPLEDYDSIFFFKHASGTMPIQEV
jgi:erythromycin esterase-like protein